MTFEGINNFRDMGGVKTKDGRTVKTGLLFRCGHLANATGQDVDLLNELGVQLIFDYRDEREAINYPTPELVGVRNLRVPAIKEDSAVKVGSIGEAIRSGALDTIVENFSKFYSGMAFGNPAYKALLDEVLKCDGPLIHHCTAGKDRTGVGATLIYLLLGVSEENIIEEYLLTNKSNSEKPPQWYVDLVAQIGEDERLKAIVGVSRELLQAVFDAIREKYGGYEEYFEAEYGITANDIEKLRNYYLI